MKIFKYFLIAVMSVAAACVVFYFIKNEPLPKGEKDKNAGLVLLEMLRAVNFDAWVNTPLIAWVYDGKNQYLWDKKNNVVQVKWNDTEVVFNTVNRMGSVIQKDEKLSGMKKERLIKEAWQKWKNDSFWLNAPARLQNKDTEIYFVKDDLEGKLFTALPGNESNQKNSYLWDVNENYLPESVKIWGGDYLFGGTEATFEAWTQLSGGALVTTAYKIGAKTIIITNLQDGNQLADFELPEDYFKPFY